MTLNEYGVSFRGNKNVMKLDCDDGCTPCKYTLQIINL